jgi:leucyl-tRNA synthetase
MTTSISVGEKGMFKRDFLVSIEKQMQQKWQEEHLFEQDAPAEFNEEDKKNKFMVTFPYPYMNGRLHLGHSFSISKAEFAAAFERLCGKKVLFPFAFHCTGMPIVAAADKLRKEIAQFGCPPQFPEEESATTAAKHSKVAAKTGGLKYQWQIMEALGVPKEEIPSFVDSYFWTKYFPPLTEKDLKALGCGIDWRRSFITTAANPFYDAFVQWQFRKLYNQGRIKFGKRNTIYSPLDGQPCLDHDRASGEGVDPKEFTCIKLQVCEPLNISPELSDKKVFLVAATLRPETMYGQTNCWVGPDVVYGVFKKSPSEFYVCTERSARNMAFQLILAEFGKYEKIFTLKGSDLIGLKIKGPLAVNEHFYVLPMMSVSEKIGTGIVTSVPSSSPDDYAALRDLKEKEALRAKFGIKDEWVLPFNPINICSTEAFASAPSAAEYAITQFNIRSQNDRDLLEKAKALVYKEEFYSGKMIIGKYQGMAIQEAKNKITAEIISEGQAFSYFEPENRVVSRSGDECVVALCDQWFIAYGEPEWRDQAKKCLSQMEVFMPEVRHQFEQTLDWMQQWACSRSFGLGTKLPWDPKYVIESLSDSTIYMAYYSVAHILHGGSTDGSKSPNGIKPEQMTDEVWEYIFGEDNVPFPSESGLSSQILEKMRNEFPERFWPRAFRANGHLLLNSEKMSKSTGNFMSINDSIQKFGVDATRIALADSGDSLEDANFVNDTADKSILRLYTSIEHLKEFIEKKNDPQEFRTGDYLTIDKVFSSEINKSVLAAKRAYEKMEYREALKEALFELQNSRDFYRDVCVVHGNLKMHKDLLSKFFELQCFALAPITPHFSDYIWRELLNKSHTILTAGYPQLTEPEEVYIAIGTYLRKTTHDLRLAMINDKTAKGSKSGEIFVALNFPEWQERAIEVLQKHWDSSSKAFTLPDDKLVGEVRQFANPHKKLIPFAMDLRKKCLEHGSIKTLNRKLEFNEANVLNEHLFYIQNTFGLENLKLTTFETPISGNAKMDAALPGQPSIHFY